MYKTKSKQQPEKKNSLWEPWISKKKLTSSMFLMDHLPPLVNSASPARNVKSPGSIHTCSRARCHWRTCLLPDPRIPWPSRTAQNRCNSIYAELNNLWSSYHKEKTNKQTMKYKYTQIDRLNKLTEHGLMDCFSLRGFRTLPRFTRVVRLNYFILSKEDYDQSSTISTNPPFIGSTRNTYEPSTANALRQCL